jgi:ABC-type transport system involved in multi-copper enzyme maturation permease subunit
MYLWKCWSESRNQFLGWAAVTASLTVLFTCGITRGLWQFASPTLLLAGIVTLFLASGLLADEFRTGTMEMLLTRPRKRRYFVWASWTFGMVETIAIVSILVLTTMATSLYITGRIPGSMLLLLPLTVPYLAILFGLTYSLSVLLKSGRIGFGIGLGIYVLRRPILNILEGQWNWKLPWWWFDNLPFLASGPSPLPHGELLMAAIGWTGAALLFPFLAQWSVERRDP